MIRKFLNLEEITWVIHPVFFALYAVLSLLASNVAIVDLSDVRAIFAVLVAAIFFTVLLNVVLKDFVKAGLLTSGAIILISSYGHVKNLTASFFSSFDFLCHILGSDLILSPIWIIFFGAWVYWVMRKLEQPEIISGYLNVVSLIVILFPIYTIVTFAGRASAAKSQVQDYIAQAWDDASVRHIEKTLQPPASPVPDVYYIILDAYTRADVLEELYDYDNAYFIDFLEARGFYVAKESQANYVHTDLSLTSSLNMMYLDTMPAFFRQRANLKDVSVVRSVVTGELMRRNRVKTAFQGLGYEIVTFGGGYGARIEDADIFMRSSDASGIDVQQVAFEIMLLDTTLGQAYVRFKGQDYGALQKLFASHREGVIFALENLPNFARAEGDYFVFAHIVSPHVPYVFGPQGEEIKHNNPYTLLDARPGREENIGYYRDQLHYLNTLVMETIDQILAESDTPPIIILQSDHSSKVYRDVDPPDAVKMKLLFPILNAYHLPGVGAERLYATITPVNSFRLIFNHYFGAGLELLEDSSYVLDGGTFIEACEVYPVCH